jgi:hypothetical protein
MRHQRPAHHVRIAGVLATLAIAAPCGAQAPAAPTPAAPATPATAAPAAAHAAHTAPAQSLGAEDAAALARIAVAIAQVRDSTQKELALVRNKTPQAQAQLREHSASQVSALLRAASLSDAEFRRRTYLVSTDTAARRVFDETVAKLTGGAAPGVSAATTAAAAPAASTVAAASMLPSGPLGTHLGHVTQSFGDTPNKMGLLPTALAEARTAAQHAALAARDPGDLAAMKLHAGHVLYALAPAQGASGPGLGYGVKRAAEGVAAHVTMAGEAPGAAPLAKTHAEHVATSARNTARRSDEVAALATKIQGAATAADAAALVSQLVSAATELVEGKDADANGKVDWKEGGLAAADEHVKLMITAAAATTP